MKQVPTRIINERSALFGKLLSSGEIDVELLTTDKIGDVEIQL